MEERRPASQSSTGALGTKVDRTLLEEFRTICNQLDGISQRNIIEAFLDYFINNLTEHGRRDFVSRFAMIRGISGMQNLLSQ